MPIAIYRCGNLVSLLLQNCAQRQSNRLIVIRHENSGWLSISGVPAHHGDTSLANRTAAFRLAMHNSRSPWCFYDENREGKTALKSAKAGFYVSLSARAL
jgi:hypothetical protein